MKPARAKRKRKECQNHREIVYGNALDRLIEGKSDPEYVKNRFDKLKQIRNKPL